MGFIVFISDRLFIVKHLSLVIEIKAVHFKDSEQLVVVLVVSFELLLKVVLAIGLVVVLF